MKIVIRRHKSNWWWMVVFENYPAIFQIGRVSRMPTIMAALRIVKAWKLTVIDGRPYYFYDGKLNPYGA